MDVIGGSNEDIAGDAKGCIKFVSGESSSKGGNGVLGIEGNACIGGEVLESEDDLMHKGLSKCDLVAEHRDDGNEREDMHDVVYVAETEKDLDECTWQSCSGHPHEGGDYGEDMLDVSKINLEPHEGMLFQSYEEALSFYKAYGKHKGFVVTKRSTRRSMRDDKIIDGKFVCSRYGKKQEKSNVKYPRPSARIECKAAMHVKKRESDGKWYAYHFMKDHNHELTKDDPCISQSRRRNKNNILIHDVGVQTDTTCASTSEVPGGSQNIDCLGADRTGELEQCLPLEAGDAEAMHEFFRLMQEENPNFFYALDLNRDQHLRNVFWVDAKGRHDYISFRDVVLFDMTCVAENYKMPLAPFIGVNHHGQLTLLGCALIVDRAASTILWLMKVWLTAMGGKIPELIITDEDKTMKAVIAQVIPNSRHYFCTWNIISRIPKKLSHVTQQHQNFMEKFNKCIYKSLASEIYERRWWRLISRFDLGNDEWLRYLYEERMRWVPAYTRGVFLAGASSMLRSESIASLFDSYVSEKTTLKEFVEHYNVTLQDRCKKESLADFESWNTRPELKSSSCYEFQMSLVYTRQIFYKFQMEVSGAQACCATKEREDGTIATFRVNGLEQELEFIVDWNETDSTIFCSCYSFEVKGFLCRHALTVLQLSGIPDIPSLCILKRWTKDSKSSLTLSLRPDDCQSRLQRFNDLCRRAINLTQGGLLSQAGYNSALSVLEEGTKKCIVANDPYRHDGSSWASSAHSLQKESASSSGIPKTKGATKRALNGEQKENKHRQTSARGGEGKKRPRLELEAPTDGMHLSLHGTRQVEVDPVNIEESVHDMQHLELSTPMGNIFFGNQGTSHRMEEAASSTSVEESYHGMRARMQNPGQTEARALIIPHRPVEYNPPGPGSHHKWFE